MTIYVDDPLPIGGRFANWCHLWSATHDLAELHQFAARLGLKRQWFQESYGLSGPFPHYDVSPGKRALALRWGAQYKPLKEYIMERMKDIEETKRESNAK